MEFNLREIFGINLRPSFFVFLIMCSRTYVRKLMGLLLYLTYILIGVTPTYLVKILFFLLARLNLPFVVPGLIFWLYTRDRQ